MLLGFAVVAFFVIFMVMENFLSWVCYAVYAWVILTIVNNVIEDVQEGEMEHIGSTIVHIFVGLLTIWVQNNYLS